MKTSVKVLLIGTLSILGVSGLAKIVSAQFPATPPSSHTLPAEISDGDGETNDDARDFQALTKITPNQAQQAAETAMGKRADQVELENDDGNLVYAVSFGQQDVKIDAGNGVLLYTDNQRDEQTQATHPRSSIQVSGTDAEDSDGETNHDR